MRIERHRPLILILVVLIAAGGAVASTLDEYLRRVDSAHVIAKELVDVVANEDAEMEEEKVAELRGLIPRAEKVTSSNGTIDVDNAWLAASLDDLTAEKDTSSRLSLLTAIDERLGAISDSVGELVRAEAASRSKDEDKQKLAEILQRPEYQKAQPKEESLFQKWWREFIDWLARVFPRTSPGPVSGTNFDSLKIGMQVLIFALVLGLIVFLLWRSAPYISQRFRKRDRREKQDRVILGERVGADESAADIFGEAERLAQLGDHRGAIRKGYIALLCELGDRKIVRLARHKTNRDYLRDVHDRGELLQAMTGLTGNFERSWYGLKLAAAEDWEEFSDRCRSTIASVGRTR